MKLICSYSALVDALSEVSSVVEDSLNSEEMKSVIFRLSKVKKLELIGINQLITFRKEIDDSTYTIEAEDTEYNDSGVFFMQVKSKELTSYLNTFKTVRRTEVEDTIFETVKNKVKLTVMEHDTEDVEKKHLSSWLFDSIPIKPNLLPSINMQVPSEGVEQVQLNEILFYTSNLLPIIQNGTNLYSKLIFGEDKVVAFNASFNTLMSNMLPSVFKKVSLSYRAISFMKNVLCSSDNSDISVAKLDRHICFKTDTVEAFIIYENKIADYHIYANMYNEEHGIILDRVYLKDVLKRLSLMNDAVEMKIRADDGVLEVRNSKFNQEVPILRSKGMSELGEIRFKILPDVINRAIIGGDDWMDTNVYIYLVPNTNGSYTIIFTDGCTLVSGEKSWFSTASIR